jgi:hypothetical protein
MCLPVAVKPSNWPAISFVFSNEYGDTTYKTFLHPSYKNVLLLLFYFLSLAYLQTEKPKKKCNFGGLEVDGKIILKCILKKLVVDYS